MRCSGRAPPTSRAIVVRGRQATWKCRRLKSELRKALHCTSYRNPIHSGDGSGEPARCLRGPKAVPYAGILIRGLTMPGHDDINVIMYLRRYSELEVPSRFLEIWPRLAPSPRTSEPSRCCCRNRGSVPPP